MIGGIFIMQNPEYIRSMLAQSIGTSQYWKVFPDFLITDGVKIMVELCEANWLISDIFLLSRNKKVRKNDFVINNIGFSFNWNKFIPRNSTDNSVPLIADIIIYTISMAVSFIYN